MALARSFLSGGFQSEDLSDFWAACGHLRVDFGIDWVASTLKAKTLVCWVSEQPSVAISRWNLDIDRVDLTLRAKTLIRFIFGQPFAAISRWFLKIDQVSSTLEAKTLIR
jgi:hypothetical protein